MKEHIIVGGLDRFAAYERTHSAEISKGAGLLGTKSGALLPEIYRLPIRSD